MKKGTLLATVLVAATWLHAGDKDKPAAKLENKVVDSGSFGIYADGKRIGNQGSSSFTRLFGVGPASISLLCFVQVFRHFVPWIPYQLMKRECARRGVVERQPAGTALVGLTHETRYL